MGRYKDRIDARFEAQEQKGIEKYGQRLEDNHGPHDYRLEHLAQELTDALIYVEWIKEAGQTIVTMFKLLAQDLEAQELCPMKTPCEPEHLEDNGCIECLINHYTKKAEEAIIHDRS
jgi:hypothetical protein